MIRHPYYIFSRSMSVVADKYMSWYRALALTLRRAESDSGIAVDASSCALVQRANSGISTHGSCTSGLIAYIDVTFDPHSAIAPGRRSLRRLMIISSSAERLPWRIWWRCKTSLQTRSQSEVPIKKVRPDIPAIEPAIADLASEAALIAMRVKMPS